MVAYIPGGGEVLVGLPDDEGAYGIPLDDAVEEARRSSPVPDEVALEARDLDPALIDVADEGVVLSLGILR